MRDSESNSTRFMPNMVYRSLAVFKSQRDGVTLTATNENGRQNEVTSVIALMAKESSRADRAMKKVFLF